MCCLRKSPFHRKNVTKLLNHPFILSQLNRLEKSFDDVSELNFDERPRSSREYRRPSSKRSSKVIGSMSQQLNFKAPENTAVVKNDPQADLLNILKKIERHRKSDQADRNFLNVEAPQPRPKSQSIDQRFTQQPSRNEGVAFKKSPEIDFLNVGNSQSRGQYISNHNNEGQDKYARGTRVVKPGVSYPSHRSNNARAKSQNIKNDQSFSDDVSSSEFI